MSYLLVTCPVDLPQHLHMRQYRIKTRARMQGEQALWNALGGRCDTISACVGVVKSGYASRNRWGAEDAF